MRLISVYSPPTFLKPIIIVSTSVHYPNDDNDEKDFNENETALMFIEALNNNYALMKMYAEDSPDWIKIKQHNSKKEAMAYHNNLAFKLCRGYEDHWNFYNELFIEHCPNKEKFQYPIN